jgi:hypothetical protein
MEIFHRLGISSASLEIHASTIQPHNWISYSSTIDDALWEELATPTLLSFLGGLQGYSSAVS